MTDANLLRQTLSLLQQRCQAYHEWETAFKKVLASSSQADGAAVSFQATAQSVAQSISRISVALKELQKKEEDEKQQSETTKKKNSFLSSSINQIQQHEKAKFESTAKLQKLVMSHMRGEGCNEFVHEHECLVYNHVCFSFIGGSRVAQVTAAASMQERRRVGEFEEETKKKATGMIDASSSSSDDDDDHQKEEKKKFTDPAVPSINMKDCRQVSALVGELQQTIRKCEDAVSEITDEMQAALCDASS